MAKLGRPFEYDSDEERPVTVSLRIPRDLYNLMEHYRKLHQQSITEILLDGLKMRLDTPADPRDVILSDDNTVIREVQEMIQTAVRAEIGKLGDFLSSSPFRPPSHLETVEEPEPMAAPKPPQAAEAPSHRATVDEPEPAPQPTAQPAIPLALEPAPKTAHPVPVPQSSETPTPQHERLEPAVKTMPELSEDIVKIAEARQQSPDISERTFIQLLYDRGIYRHRAKDGSEVPLPHSTYRDWMQRARDAGIL
jgi:hypothetical protein